MLLGFIIAVALDDVLQTALPNPNRGDLGGQVSLAFFRSKVKALVEALGG